MLIDKKLPQGRIYPQITQAPDTYADFLNSFRDGHTIDDRGDEHRGHAASPHVGNRHQEWAPQEDERRGESDRVPCGHLSN